MKKIKFMINSILKSTPDPLSVRESTAKVVTNSRLVSIRYNAINALSHLLKRKIQNRQLLTQEQFRIPNPSPQHIFIINSINFCYWAKIGQKKWKVKHQNQILDGWDALTACFARALKENLPILDAKYLKSISISKAKYIFRSCNQTTIPLLNHRVNNLKESGKILQKKFNNNFINLIRKEKLSAPKIAKAIITHFPSFNDFSRFNGNKVNFFKRAQICAYDLSLLRQLHIKDTQQLTIFADYKLPQLLRSFGILRYKQSLANKLDSLYPIKQSSREEIEIRSATIWACELLAEKLQTTPALIDNAIWLLAQDKTRKIKPYHRTLTTSY